MSTSFESFKKRISNRLFFKQFLLAKLPAAFFAGLKVEALTEETATVTVSYTWFNTNPFRSIYFAVLTMAAEMSTGLLCMGYLYNRSPTISLLVTEQRSVFHKKATGKILFICYDGNMISAAVEQAAQSGNAVTITCYAKGINGNNEMVAECWITWSFKQRSGKAV